MRAVGWGVGLSGPLTGPPDFAPLLAAFVALLSVRFVAGIRLTPAVAASSACIGVLWLLAIDAWGFALAGLAALLACVVLVSSHHAQAGGDRRTTTHEGAQSSRASS